MNRRQMMAIPGVAAAAAAGQSLAKAAEALPSGKMLSKYGSSKSSYKIPKNATKKNKYVSFLSTLLALDSNQQQQADAIYTAAMTSRTSLHARLQASNQSLAQAVRSSDNSAITQISASIGAITAQLRSNAANANAAVFQVLTADQQAKLMQLQS